MYIFGVCHRETSADGLKQTVRAAILDTGDKS